MKNKLILLLFLLSTSWAFGQNPNVDILHYHFALTLNDQNDRIKGEATIKFMLKSGSDAVLDLVSQEGESEGMRVTAIAQLEPEQDGHPQRFHSGLHFVQRKDKLIVPLGPQLNGPSIKTLRIRYEGQPTDGLIISKNKYGDRTFFGDNWPNRAHHWLPCIDHPSDKATVEFLVTAPEHYEVVANGFKLEESSINDSTKLTHWRSTTVLPTKVMVFGAARFAIKWEGLHKNIPVSSWVYPQDRDKGFFDYAMAMQVLDFMEKSIAPYPYAKLANVQSKTRYGGMENASAIFYSESSVDGKRSSEELIAHEIAHQWFGNSASEREWHHVWLSEGFATYFTHLYVEDTYGREKMNEGLLDDRVQVLSFLRMAPKLAIVDTSIHKLVQLLNPLTYQKASWVLHALRFELGDETFWKGVRAYYEKYKFANAITEDFKNVMEEASGKELDAFFEQWIFRPGVPRLEGRWKWNAKKKKIKIDIEQVQKVGGVYAFPLEIGFYDSDGELIQIHKMDLTKKEQSCTVSLPKTPAKVRLDPNVWILMRGEMKELGD